jgi:type I restriction enzyme S subunit
MAAEVPIPYPGEWPVVRLGDIALKISSGATPTGGQDSYLTERSHFALVRSQNVFDRRFDKAGLAFISDEQADRLKGVVLREGDLLLNITGDGITFSRACAVPSEVLPACVNQHVAVVRVDPRVAEPGYVLAYLTHPSVKSYIEAFNAGGSRRAITKGHIESFRLALPPLREQRAIAQILDTLDNKIELNRRMSETLEAIARTLFKSWFVDFDPVRAKAEDRDSGLPKYLADLFTDSFEDSELGAIPKGWRVQPFADAVEVIGGGTPKTAVADFWNGDIPWFSVADAPRGSDVWVLDTEKKITREGVESSSTRVLPIGTTIISARGTVGRIALVGVPMAMNQSCYALRGKTRAQWPFTYFATRELVARLQQHAHGSVFDTITRDTLGSVSVALPPAALIEGFEASVGPILKRIRAALLASRGLAALRDTLLPKLISGQLRLKDAERVAAEASA